MPLSDQILETITLAEKLKRGVDAAQNGHKQEARLLLAEVVEADDTQVEAWLWLGRSVDSLEEQAICYENILALQPEHEFARAELARIETQQARFFRPVYAPGEEQPPVGMSLPPAATQPITRDYPHQDEFDDPWLCPYCLAPTRPQDRSCPACKRALLLTGRDSTERSVWLWRGIFLQITILLLLFGSAAASYLLLLRFNRITQPLTYLPLYVGQPSGYPPEQDMRVLELFPVWLFWSFAGAMVYSAALIPLLYFRVKHGNTIYLISGSLMLAWGAVLLLFFYDSYAGLAAGLLSFLFGGGQLLITFNLWDDFKFRIGRLQFKLDPGVTSHTSFYISGRKYARLGMWGLAALHLRRAVGREPRRAVYHLALAVAYYHLQRHALARKSLAEAERLDPAAPEIEALRNQLNP